jgi:hypothetical protein
MLREVKTPEGERWSEMEPEERAAMQRISQSLAGHERSELETGKLLVEAKRITEKYRSFLYFLNTLPFTVRTAYRRMKMYEKAVEIWPPEVIERAIERHSPMMGVTNDKPMGAYEDLKRPELESTEIPDHPFPAEEMTIEEKIDNYLISAERQVRAQSSRWSKKQYDPRYLLKNCFRSMEQAARGLSEEGGERKFFLEDLIGLAMTLFDQTKEQTFAPVQIPQEFWTTPVGRYPRLPRAVAQRINAVVDQSIAARQHESEGGKHKVKGGSHEKKKTKGGGK